MLFEWHRSEFERLVATKTALPHAMLLRGQQGIGKSEFARGLAQALLCENPEASGSACRGCEACRWFDVGTHPDFRQIEPENLAMGREGEADNKKASAQISVDQIRSLADVINNTSYRGGAKVMLIQPADALNVHAANALLKSLEEPPPRTFFLLVSHRPHLLLPTIRSRCRHIMLRGPDRKAGVEWLKDQGMANPELGLAQTANSPLLALQLGEDYWDLRDRLLSGLASEKFDPLALADDLRDQPIPQVVGCMQRWTYDIILEKRLGKVLYNPDRKAAIADAAARVDELAALRFHREMVRAQRIVHHPLNARLFVEQLLLSYAELAPPAHAKNA